MPEITPEDQQSINDNLIILKREREALEKPWWTSQSERDGAWLWRLWRRGKYPPVIAVEASRDSHWLRAALVLGSGDGEQFLISLGLPKLGLLSISLAHLPIPRWITHHRASGAHGPWWQARRRQVGFTYFIESETHPVLSESHFHVDLGSKRFEWNSTDPKWMSFSFSPLDFFLGRLTSDRRVLASKCRRISIDDVDYPFIVEISETVFRRPRWLAQEVVVRASIEVPEGHPGLPYLSSKPDRPTQSWSFVIPGVDPFAEAMSHLRKEICLRRAIASVQPEAIKKCNQILDRLNSDDYPGVISWGSMKCVDSMLVDRTLTLFVGEADPNALDLQEGVRDLMMAWLYESPYSMLVDLIRVEMNW